jgi:hypothetical protein
VRVLLAWSVALAVLVLAAGTAAWALSDLADPATAQVVGLSAFLLGLACVLTSGAIAVRLNRSAPPRRRHRRRARRER